MKIVDVVTGEQLIEVSLQGVRSLNPLECRDLLDVLRKSPLADAFVIRVGRTTTWTKLASRWGALVQHEIEDVDSSFAPLKEVKE